MTLMCQSSSIEGCIRFSLELYLSVTMHAS